MEMRPPGFDDFLLSCYHGVMDLALVYAQLIRIEGLDIWDGLSHMGCNRAVYAEALKTFCGDLEKKNAGLVEFLEQENWKKYAATIHAIKGGLEGIGARELAQCVRELEAAVNEADYGFCKKNSRPLLQKTGLFIDELRAGALFDEDAIEREQVSPEYLKQKFSDLYRFCSSGSSTEAEALARELRTKTCDPATDAMLDSICTHVENLDYHLALRLLSP
jgi:HPt (histidine-containing phosphotransfer) domain-containing protein